MLSARGWFLVAALLVLVINPTLGQSKDVEVLERIQELENVILKLQARVVDLEKRLEISELEFPDRRGNEDISLVPQEHTIIKQRSSLRWYWDEGLQAESPNRNFRFEIGGRLMNDWAFMGEDRDIRNLFGNLQDGTEFRSSRFGIEGTIYDRVEFSTEYDFSGGQANFKDVYLGVLDMPIIGSFRFGHFKEPFSLEENTSGRFTTFMERSLGNTFVPGRQTGMMVHDELMEQRLTWAVGIFRGVDSFGDSSRDGEYNMTMRVTGLPIYADQGAKLLHLGFAYSLRNPVAGFVKITQRPEVNLAPEFVDTGILKADSAKLFGLEGAWLRGPALLQGEFIQNAVVLTQGGNVNFSSWYIQGSYFLTGEYQSYELEDAAFDRVRPRRNLFDDRGGLGAWQLAARYSQLDINDVGVSGGEMRNLTLGLNWYLNPNTRLMWNYVSSELQSVGEANMLQMRFQVDF